MSNDVASPAVQLSNNAIDFIKKRSSEFHPPLQTNTIVQAKNSNPFLQTDPAIQGSSHEGFNPTGNFGWEGQQWDIVLRSSERLRLSGYLLHERIREVSRKRWKKFDSRLDSTFAGVVKSLQELERRAKLRKETFKYREYIQSVFSELHSYEKGLAFLSRGVPELQATICSSLSFLLQACRNDGILWAELFQYMTQTEELFGKFMRNVHNLNVKPESEECVTGFYINFTNSLTEMVTSFEKSAVHHALAAIAKPEFSSKSEKIASYLGTMRSFVDRMNQLQSLTIHETVLGMEKSQNALAELLRATLSQVAEERHTMRLESMKQEALRAASRRMEEVFHMLDPTNPSEQPPSGRREIRHEHGRVSQDLENIVNPPIEYLRQLHSLLPEGCSYVGLDILGTAEVANWIESSSPSLLWLEGYSTQAIFKWTTEFALDVVYAGQEKGYVVLYHFCDLLISAGKDDYLQQPTAILKSLLCLLQKQMAGLTMGRVSKDAARLTADEIIKFDVKKAWEQLTNWIGALAPGTVIYIVIDSIDTLHNGTEDFAKFTKGFIPKLSTLIRSKNSRTTVKILFTSLSPQTTQEFWPLVENYSKIGDGDSDSDSDDISVLQREVPGRCYLSRPAVPDQEAQLNHKLLSFATPSRPIYQSASSDSDNESHNGERNVVLTEDPSCSKVAGPARKKKSKRVAHGLSETESSTHTSQDSDTESEDMPRNKKSNRKSSGSQSTSSDLEDKTPQTSNGKGPSRRGPHESKASSNRKGKNWWKKRTSSTRLAPSEKEPEIE